MRKKKLIANRTQYSPFNIILFQKQTIESLFNFVSPKFYYRSLIFVEIANKSTSSFCHGGWALLLVYYSDLNSNNSLTYRVLTHSANSKSAIGTGPNISVRSRTRLCSTNFHRKPLCSGFEDEIEPAQSQAQDI